MGQEAAQALVQHYSSLIHTLRPHAPEPFIRRYHHPRTPSAAQHCVSRAEKRVAMFGPCGMCQVCAVGGPGAL